MQISDLEALTHALSLFHEDEKGVSLQSSLFDLEINCRVWEPPLHQVAQSAIRHIHHDLWCMALLVSRLEWMRTMSKEGALHQSFWRIYSQLDIEALVIQLRSMMDYSVTVIDSFSPKQNQLPNSFRKLRGSLDKYTSRLPEGSEPLIRKADWFDTIRTVRDALVHDGAEPLVFYDTHDEILFQVHDSGGRQLIVRDEFMHNENVVYFDRFAAWSIAHVLNYLDSLGKLFIGKINVQPSVGPSSSQCPGFDELHAWIWNLHKILSGRGNAPATQSCAR